ncbi:DLW-39 family protein [Angustibacter peucedani]
MKKLLVLAAAGVGAFAVWRKVEADKAEQNLWAEATDSV